MKLLPAFAASRAGSSWPPRWKRNAVIVSTSRSSSSRGPRHAPFVDVDDAHDDRRHAPATSRAVARA